MPTLEQQSRAFANDYAALEAVYRDDVGAEMVTDPYRSPFFSPSQQTVSASVIVPAWNAAETLTACLTAIEHCSFNRRYPDRLEVIVVDDGSIDGTWDLLSTWTPAVRFTAVRQRHFSRAHAQNTGIALAAGDVIIACDADMVLGTFAIEELVKRHQLIGDAMLLGFRADIAPDDPRIRTGELAAQLPTMVPPFDRDIRLNYGAGVWPDNMCRDTDHLKGLGRGREIIMSDGGRWDLPGMVYGALFSMLRPTLQAMDGYDERFYGWGCEDTLIGARALAMGVPIVPIYSATGWHIAHGDRSPRKWHEFAANRRAYRAILASPFQPGEGHYLARARDRVANGFERAAKVPPGGPDLDAALNALETEMNDPARRGKVLHALGRYREAAEVFADIQGSPREQAWAGFDRGKALRAAGSQREAVAVLSEVTDQLPDSAWPLVELGSALAGCGDFASARTAFDAAAQRDPRNPVVAHVLEYPASRHVERAWRTRARDTTRWPCAILRLH
jgi:GT2 family glycosyltransferase